MKRLILALLLVAGCRKPDAPTAFGVDVTIDASGATTSQLSSVTQVLLTTVGDDPSPYSMPLDIAALLRKGPVTFRYIPSVRSGTLTFHLDLLDASGTALLVADSEVTLIAGKAVLAKLMLTEATGSSPDLGAGGDDLASPPDLSPYLAKGQACSTSSQCLSGNCVDGYCCDGACSGSCTACNVTGFEGTCTNVVAGHPPVGSRTPCGPDVKSTCMRDGMCDGQGACRLWAQGTVCAASTCVSATNKYTPPSTCDGKGVCNAQTAITCAPYVCQDATQCYGTCTTGGSQCSTGNVCTSGSCGLKPNGQTCTAASQCSSNFCVDGVCCNGACTGQCQACSITAGTCTTVTGAPVGSRTACTTDGSSCGGSCDGGHPTACTYPPSTMQCRAASCSAGVATSAANCDGAGKCPTSTMTNCTPYVCGTNACKSAPCSSDADCIQGDYCDGTGSCSPWSPNLLPSPAFWFDGAGASADANSMVTYWSDKSGHGNNATNDVTGPTLVANVLNGKSVLHFGTGGATALKISDSATLQWGNGPVLLAAVVRFSNSGDGIIYAKTVPNVSPYAGPALFAGYSANGLFTSYVGQSAANHSVASGNGYGDSTFRIVVFLRDASGNIYLRINGNNVTSGTGATNDASAMGYQAEIGHSNSSTAQAFVGDLAELVGASGAWSGTDLARLDGYLRAKYGL